MANFEKYKGKILEIVNQGKSIALGSNNKIYVCDELGCACCMFSRDNNVNCTSRVIKWLYEKATPTLTKKERAFCEIVDHGYIARDEDEGLYIFRGKPTKVNDENMWDIDGFYMELDFDCFLFVKWDDEEPWSIEDLLKLEVEE